MIGGHEAVLGVATCHDELIEVLRARKAALGLSNELLDHLIPLANGHTDKILGPLQARGLSQFSLDGMLSVLAIKLIVIANQEQAVRMKARWEGRDIKQVRPPTRLAKAMVRRLSAAARRSAS